MTDSEFRRSWWSTALISFFCGVFGGFLWIGAGRLAVASLAVLAAGLIFFCYYGFPALPHSAWLATYSGLAFSLLSVVIVLPFRNRFKADKWYANGVWVVAFSFLPAWFIAFLVRGFLFQPFSIPTSSMEPTLLPGDHLFVSKFAYGYGPFTLPFGLLPVEGRLFGAMPQRGDIAVFKLPSDTNLDYIQRVIGLPGDKVQMVGGVLHINGEPVPVERLGPYSSEETPTSEIRRETLPEGQMYRILDLKSGTLGDDTEPFDVPADHYFMLGDNRDNATDSRFTVGMVPYENFVGKAVRLFWNANGTEYKSRQALD
jgi:signal peptidase I